MPIWFVVFACIPLAAFRGVGLRKFYVGAAIAALLLGEITQFVTPSQLAYDMLAIATAADPSAGRSNLRIPSLLLRYGAVVARSLFAMGIACALGAVIFRARKAVVDKHLSFPMKGDAEPDPVEPEAGAVQEATYLLISGHEAPEPGPPEAPAALGSPSAGHEAGAVDYLLLSGHESPAAEPEAPPARTSGGAAFAAEDVTYPLVVGEHGEPAESSAPPAASGTESAPAANDVTFALMVGVQAEPAETRAPAAVRDTVAGPQVADAAYALMVGEQDEPAGPRAPLNLRVAAAGPQAADVTYGLMIGDEADTTEAEAPPARNDTALDAAGLVFPMIVGDSGTADPDEPDARWKGLWPRWRRAGPDD